MWSKFRKLGNELAETREALRNSENNLDAARLDVKAKEIVIAEKDAQIALRDSMIESRNDWLERYKTLLTAYNKLCMDLLGVTAETERVGGLQ